MSKVRDSKKKFDACKFLSLFSFFAIPFFSALEVVILNNSSKFNELFKYGVLFFLLLFVIIFLITLFILIKHKMIFNFCNVRKKLGIIFIFLAFTLWLVGIVSLFYYNESFKEWLITSSFCSLNYKHVATSFYSNSTIEEVVEKNSESIDLSGDIVDFSDIQYKSDFYANKHEEEILKREEGALYKIIKISGTTIGSNYHYEGYMAVIYDPSKVTLAKSSGAGVDELAYGETLETISRKNNAIIAMNAGGFYDPNWSSNGGIPHGDVIINGKLDTTYTRGIESGGLVGFNKDNKLILKKMSAKEALDSGIRDAVDWGPYLIVNGVDQFRNVNYYTWACARTAIGQRADGIVLMLVIDGLQEHSKGVAYADLSSIMARYGVVNAASMDGGTSTSMTVNHKYINSPWNGYVKTYRWLPNAWIVKE